MSEEIFLQRLNIIPAGRRAIIRSKDRFMVWLPQNLNHVWKYLNREGKKVSVYIVIEDDRTTD